MIALVEHVQKQGYRVGVISRGYKSHAPYYPYILSDKDTAYIAGDEPLLIYHRTGCPVAIGSDRVKSAYALKHTYDIDVIISDDGLQHIPMPRDIEIAVVDGQRYFGNGWCLPAGPLREPVSRLKTVDMIVVQGKTQSLDIEDLDVLVYPMQFQVHALIHIQTGKRVALSTIPKRTKIAAVVGIGNPERFFLTLDELEISYTPYVFPDHHCFDEKDLNVSEPMVIMTEKDAIKCRDFAAPTWYALSIVAVLDNAFFDSILQRLNRS